MILDHTRATEDDPVVTLKMTKSQAEYVSAGISDILCWTNGFMAAKGDDFRYDPMGTDQIRELNIKLKKAIEDAS